MPSGITDNSLTNCGYNTTVNPSTTRAYLSICNDNDPLIPYNGGFSPVGVDSSGRGGGHIIAQHKDTMSSSANDGNPMGMPHL